MAAMRAESYRKDDAVRLPVCKLNAPHDHLRAGFHEERTLHDRRRPQPLCSQAATLGSPTRHTQARSKYALRRTIPHENSRCIVPLKQARCWT